MNKDGMTNGFTFRSWSDVSSFIVIILFIISGLVWGMKLEGRYDTLDVRMRNVETSVSDVKATVDEGILDIAKERIDALNRQMEAHRKEHDNAR